MRILICALIALFPNLVLANDWDALNQPGAVAIMRHALAPGTGDPENLELGNCDTQRNLDARGMAQARAIGEAFRKNGFEFSEVWTSQWCRTTQTAELLKLGPVVPQPALNSFFRDRSTRDAQTRKTLELLQETDKPVMLVTHFVNISALTGETTRSGEVLVIRATNQGVDVLGRIMLDP